MITTPEIVSSPEQTVAYIHLLIPGQEIATALPAALNELRDTLHDQQIAITGPWYSWHLRCPRETFDVRITMPIARAVQPTGRVEAGTREAATVLRTTYTGNYTSLPGAWGEFHDWIDKNSSHQKLRADLWEVYLVCPDTSPSPTDWLTEMNRPIA
ncbi:MAG: GyrI-like domain-containing protein [Edaphobacter sp.]|uniref:GyrI-like domain-containing protein n=1 Tax=Edaphobacter sp. TaxID=1934404 RepID=UPI0023A0EB8C|nr:GyrI-like domain-containing protein [Edaphobacter sp.]MDE1175868.1 GyrI-like domain-containing protein [Edaphobacter sp.]